MKIPQLAEQELPILFTVQGQARSGKGTLSRGLAGSLDLDHKVYLIDQGIKFRVIAAEYIKGGGEIESIEDIGTFLNSEGYQSVLSQLGVVATMTREELDEAYYTSKVNNASGMVGKSAVAQAKAVELLVDEVRQAGTSHDVIILDGRALHEKGQMLEAKGLVRYGLAIDVTCDSLTAARRETKVFTPIKNLSHDDATRLLEMVEDINLRNSSDSRRSVYPSQPISGAYTFDVMHGYNDNDLKAICSEVMKIGAVSVDNSYTRTKEQLTEPVIRLVRCVLASMM